AESFFEKTQNSSPRASRRGEKIQARQAPSGQRLDEAQFHHQRLDSVALYQTLRHTRAPVVSKSATWTNLHHLDRPRLFSHSNARGQCADRSDLVDVAERDQTTEGARISYSSFAVDRFRSRHSRAFRSSRSTNAARDRGRSADCRTGWRWTLSPSTRLQHRPRARRMADRRARS